MMKRMFLAAAALVVLTAAVSAKVTAGDSQKVEEKRELKGFERIEQRGSVDVKYRQGSTFSVKVKAPKSVIKRIITRVEGKKLVVSVKSGTFNLSNRLDDVTVYVTSPDLTGIELNGSGDFECKQHLDTDILDIALKGSGDIDFYDIICDRINVSVVGSGEVEVKNVISRQSAISLVGSGDVKLSQQKVGLTKIELRGSGDVTVEMKDCQKVESKLSGSGDITLKGNITEHKYQKRGSGDIDTKHLTVSNK